MGTNRWSTIEEDYEWPHSRPSLMYKPKLHEAPALKFGLEHAAQVTSPQGYEARTRYCQNNRFSVTYLWECVDSTMRDDLRFFYNYSAAGGLRAFWMPLWLEEFACTDGITAGAYTVGIHPNGYTRVFPNWMYAELGRSPHALFIRLKNGGQYVRPITRCLNSSTLLLEYPFPINIAYTDIDIASRCTLWTFSSGLTERWISSISKQSGFGSSCEISASFTVMSGVDDDRGRWGFIARY